MKMFAAVYTLFWLSSALIVGAQECEQVCNDRTAAITADKDAIWNEKEAVVREKDEIWHHREQIIKEKDELWHEKERLNGELQRALEEHGHAVKAGEEHKRSIESMNQEKGGVLKEVEELKKSLDKQKDDMAHYQKVAQDNQKYMQEYKNQLASQRDRAAKLDASLKQANAKIEELENTSFVKTLQKELSTGWKAVVEYWVALKNKKKGNEEF